MASTRNDVASSRASLLDDMQVSLFNSMQRLSELRVSGEIDIPQLVVVGAQNSGKSSVLEALVRFHFPVGSAKPTTRFPIKLILRKDNIETTHARIEPGTPHFGGQRQRLQDLEHSLRGLDFNHIITSAQAGLGLSASDTLGATYGNSRTFCDDVLVVERRGPSLPQLNLVDLPGLFHAVNKGQTIDDGNMVHEMVERYIKSPRNIILLVVSAEVSDYATVPALGTVQKLLAEDNTLARRAICIITRPDRAGSMGQTLKVLGRDNPFAGHFARPWHVVRNQDQQERMNHRSLEERDQIEDRFFHDPAWADVPADQKGVAALRETLKTMIRSHTQDQLPHVISELRSKIRRAEAQLNDLNRGRATPEARRAYLGDIAEKFARLTQEAVNGTYGNERCDKDHETGEDCHDCKGFFPEFGDEGLNDQAKRLRANVRALNQAFAAAMRRYGKSKVEVESENPTAPTHQSLDPKSQEQDYGEPRFQPDGTKEYYRHPEPEPQSQNEYEEWVRANMDRWKAKGPGGEPSDGTYSGLFAYQSKKWGMIASQHVKAVWQVVEEFIELALQASCADESIRTSLRHNLVGPNYEKVQFNADRTLRDLITCHGRSNSGFYDSFIEARAVWEHIKALLQRLAAMRPELEDTADTNGASTTSSTTSSTEQATSQQSTASQSNGPRQGDTKPKAQHANSSRSGEQKTKDRNQKDQEASLTNALDMVAAVVGSYTQIPFQDGIRKAVVPLAVQWISTALGWNNDAGGKEKPKRAEVNIQKTVQDLYPSDSGDIAASRVIEQVEMHYEAIRDSFVGYVASLVVEQKIMGELPESILTMTLIQKKEEDVINDIVREKPEDARKRVEIERDLKTMREVLQTMKEY